MKSKCGVRKREGWSGGLAALGLVFTGGCSLGQALSDGVFTGVVQGLSILVAQVIAQLFGATGG